MICGHVDTIQLMYAIQSEYMSGPLRTGFADLLIALHLEQFAYARSLSQNEFIIALGPHLKELYEGSEERPSIENSISTLECASIRPEMKQSERVDKVGSVKGLSSPVFPVKLLKQFVMEALNDAVKKLNRPMRDPIGGSNENLFVPLIKLIDKLLLIGCIDDCDLEWLLYLIDPTTFKNDFILKNIGNMIDISDIAGSSEKTENTEFKGLMQMPLDEGTCISLVWKVISFLCLLIIFLFIFMNRRSQVADVLLISSSVRHTAETPRRVLRGILLDLRQRSSRGTA